MKIKFTSNFLKCLDSQIEFIAQDKISAARKFKANILNKIKEIPVRPFSYRKSIFFDFENYRDLIFQGYIVVFRIENNEIEILNLIKQNQINF